MENRNWDDFRYVNKLVYWYGETSTHCEQNLQPGVIVHIHFTYTDVPALQRTYQQILDLVGNSFLYHDTGSGYPTRIRDREKALLNFPAKLQNPEENFIWQSLDDLYASARPGKGNKKPVETGGIGHTEFNAWIHKFTPEKWKKDLKARDRTPVSDMSIRMPTDQFADGQAFLKWVLSLAILQSPSLYSASAGYCMCHYDKNITMALIK